MMSAVRCLAAGVAIALLITLFDISPVVAEKFPVLDNRAGLIKSQCQPMTVLATIPNGDNIGLDVYEMNDRAKSHFSAAELLAPRSSFGDNAFIIETTVIGEGYFALMKFRRVVDLGGESYGNYVGECRKYLDYIPALSYIIKHKQELDDEEKGTRQSVPQGHLPS